MVQKRPYDAEEMLEVSFKHPKQVGPSDELVSFSESVFPENSSQMPKTSEVGCRQGSTEGDEKLASDVFVELPRGAGDLETSFPGSISVSSWATSTTSEEDVRSELPVHLSFFPEYFSPERPIRPLARYEDIYSILLEHLPRKLVSVGANHQAIVPAWDRPSSTSGPNASAAVSDSSFSVGDKSEERLMGTCIIPMPNMELSTYDSEEVGKGRTDCSCEDRGSVRCVRQHIVEAREGLIKTIGLERFTDLGLDMGEQVAEKWNPEDEQLFHEIVFNNPASLGKNFWNNLRVVFPSQTKKEIVSYYFNVFMLRRRAEQNRSDHLNVDSDNDEWQVSHDNEIATREEDEDSVAVSLVYQDDTGLTNCRENDLQDYDEYAQDETCDVNGAVDFNKRDVIDESKYVPVDIPHSCSSPLHIQPQDRIVWQGSCDDEVLDDSCTSSDAGGASKEIKVKTENGDHCPCNFNGVSNGCGQGYVMEPYDSKSWDSGFVSCSKNKIDFLPTCSMIEEVFGDGLRQEMRRA